jgi:uncharacterized protein YceK
MKRTVLAVLALALAVSALTLGGCASVDGMRTPLPKPEGEKRQMNKGLWEWRGD